MNKWTEITKTFFLGMIVALLMMYILLSNEESVVVKPNLTTTSQRYSANVFIKDEVIFIVDQEQGIVKLFALRSGTSPIVTYQFNPIDSNITKP